jgi:hypothetical protein
MTEDEWRNSENLWAMVSFLRDRASERKLRLFAVACCRRVSQYFKDPRSNAALDVNEHYADGLATSEELEAAAYDAQGARDKACWDRANDLVGRSAAEAPCQLRTSFDPHHVPRMVRQTVREIAIEAALDSGDAEEDPLEAEDSAERHEIYAQMALLDEIVGNPFRISTIDPVWLYWNDGTVRRIAEGIYEERAFDRLPILHDALLDAGCDNEDILAHCRGAGLHVRGCWVIDLILGKE